MPVKFSRNIILIRYFLTTIAFVVLANPSWGGDKLSIGNYSCILKGEAQIYPDRVQSEQFKSPEPFGLEAFKEKIEFSKDLGYPVAFLNEDEHIYSNDFPIEIQFYVEGNKANFIMDHVGVYYFLFGTCNKV